MPFKCYNYGLKEIIVLTYANIQNLKKLLQILYQYESQWVYKQRRTFHCLIVRFVAVALVVY